MVARAVFVSANSRPHGREIMGSVRSMADYRLLHPKSINKQKTFSRSRQDFGGDGLNGDVRRADESPNVNTENGLQSRVPTSVSEVWATLAKDASVKNQCVQKKGTNAFFAFVPCGCYRRFKLERQCCRAWTLNAGARRAAPPVPKRASRLHWVRAPQMRFHQCRRDHRRAPYRRHRPPAQRRNCPGQ